MVPSTSFSIPGSLTRQPCCGRGRPHSATASCRLRTPGAGGARRSARAAGTSPATKRRARSDAPHLSGLVFFHLSPREARAGRSAARMVNEEVRMQNEDIARHSSFCIPPSPPSSSQFGARLCAEHQPQHSDGNRNLLVLRCCCGWSGRHSRAPGQNENCCSRRPRPGKNLLRLGNRRRRNPPRSPSVPSPTPSGGTPERSG